MEKIVKTFCGICERTCGMQVTVSDNRVQKVEGLKEHLHSRGDLCVKGKSAMDILYAPDRLKHPRKKENGNWKEISWDEALDVITAQLDELKQTYGADSLSVYHGQTYVKDCLARFCMNRFLNVYGTVNLCSAASECFVPLALGGAATFGGYSSADVEHSRCVIIWGSNPFASGSLFASSMPRTARVLTALKEKGVRFIIIDPRTPSVSSLADIHLKVRPGTDGALALGIIRVIIEKDLYDREYVEKYTSGFDKLQEMVKQYDLEKVEQITKVSRNAIEKAAYMFATSRPASIITGLGVEHQTNTVQTIRATNILLAITGNIDCEGGNTFFAPPAFAPAAVEEIPKPSVSPIGSEEHPMFVGMIKQAHALVVVEKILEKKESPIKALIVAGGAPIP
jgi:anaerobic selenocysteine-containing dehydrogenase